MIDDPATLGAAAATAAASVTAVVAYTKLARPAVDEGVKLMHDLLGEPFKIAGSMLADQAYAWKVGNQIRIAQKLKAKLDAAGIPPRQVATGFLLTAMEAAGNVGDPTMQEMWANLLAAGVADDKNQHPMYIDALKRMNSDDAKRLKQIGENKWGAMHG